MSCRCEFEGGWFSVSLCQLCNRLIPHLSPHDSWARLQPSTLILFWLLDGWTDRRTTLWTCYKKRMWQAGWGPKLRTRRHRRGTLKRQLLLHWSWKPNKTWKSVTKSKSKLETGRLRTKRVETRKLDIARTLKNHRETYSTRDNTTTSRGKHRA